MVDGLASIVWVSRPVFLFRVVVLRNTGLLMNLWIVLVYGLDCRYDREVKKRGKGSLARSSRERSCSTASGDPNNNNAPMTPVTSASSPASSPGTFHLAIPPSHLFGGHIPDDRDGFPAIPFDPRQPQHNSYGPEHQSFHKTEMLNRGCFSPGFTGEISRYADSVGVHQKPRDQDMESISSQPGPWNRVYDTFGQPKGVPSSNAISNFQLLPYMPLCSSCQTNPSIHLYPGSIVWLHPPSPQYPPPEYETPGDEGAYSIMFPMVPIDPIGR